MALNNLGLGFVLTAKDMASSVFGTVGGAMGRLQNKAKEAGVGLEEVSARFKRVGLAMVGIGIAGLTGLGAAALAAQDFGKGIAEVSTLVDTTKFSVEDMRNIVFKMGNTFGGDLQDQIKGMYQGISAGAADAASSQALLTQANKLAVGGVTDVRTSIDGLTNVLNAYGIVYSQRNLSGVSDAFFVAIKSGKTTAAELASTLGRLAPTASAVGVSVDQMLASVSAITTKGLKTEEAITGLKQAFANIINPSADATKEAKRLGIEFTTASLRAKGLPKFLEDITKSSKFNADSFSKLFTSVEGLNAILALTANDSQAFNSILESMKTKSGETAAAFEKMSNSTAFQSQLFKGLRQQALVLIGEAVEPLFANILKGVNYALRAFNNMPAPMRRMIVLFFAAASAGAVLLGGFITLVGVISGLIAAKAVLGVALIALVAAFGLVALAAAPVVAIGGVLFLMWTRNAGGFRDTVVAALDKVRLAFDAIGQLMSSGQFSGSVLTELNNGNAGVKDFAITVFLWFNRIKDFFTGLGKGFDQAIAAAKPAFDAFVAELTKLGGLFGMTKDAPDQAKGKFKEWGEAGAKVGSILGKVVELITKGMTLAVVGTRIAVATFKNFEPVISNVKTATSGLFGSLDELSRAFGGVSGGTSGATFAFKFLGTLIGTTLVVAINSVTQFIGVISAGLSLVGGLVGAFTSVFGGIGTMVSGVVQIVKGIMSGNWGQIWTGAQMVVQGWARMVLGTILSLVSGLAGAIDKIGRICLDILKDKFSPALQVRSVLLSIQALLGAPNPEDPLATDVAELWNTNETKAIETARQWTMTYAQPRQ